MSGNLVKNCNSSLISSPSIIFDLDGDSQELLILEPPLAGLVEKGSVKLIYHRQRWYAYMPVTVDVPEVQTQKRVGVDRGQNNIAVVAPSLGFGKFHSGKEVMHRRRYFQKRRCITSIRLEV